MKKKLVSLLLVVLALFSTLAFAEETVTEEPTVNQQYLDRVAKLEALGLWQSGERQPDEEVTRSEFAMVIADMLGMRDVLLTPATYLDVSKEDEAFNAISFAKSFDIMNGVSEYAFEPARAITFGEALKTVLSALGYEIMADSRGGYVNGYFTQAAALKFTCKSGNLTWEDAAEMIEHAIEVSLLSAVTVEAPGGRVLYSAENEETVLSAYHDIVHVKGTMTNNGLTTLSGPSKLAAEYVTIGGEIFICRDPGIRKALGCELDFYYQEQEGREVLLWWDYANETEPLVLDYKALNTGSASFSKTRVEYFDENDKARAAKVDSRAAFIYNEIAYTAFTAKDMKLTSGTLTLYDGDDDGVYDILYADVYRSFKVHATNNSKTEFSDVFGKIVRTEEYDTVEVFNDMGQVAAPSTITTSDVISVFESKGKEYVRLQISTAKATAIYESYESGEDRDIYTLGGKSYRLSEYLQQQIDAGNYNVAELQVGENYRAHLDFQDEIASFDLLSNLEVYAYFLAASRTSKSQLSGEIAVRVVLEDGQLATINCADKISINQGTRVDAENLLTHADLQDGSGGWKKQLVKIRVNAGGVLYEIETAPTLSTSAVYSNVGFDPYRFSLVFENTAANYYTNGRNMVSGGGKQYTVGNDTVIFHIPPNGDPAQIRTTVGNSNTLPAKADMKGYDADASYGLGAVVMAEIADTATTDNTSYNSYLYIVSKVSEVADEEGNLLTMLTAFSHSVEWKMVEYAPGVIPDDIKAGDIVRLAVNMDDKVKRCTKIVSTDVRPAPNAFNLSDLTRTRASYNGSTSVAWGYPVGVGVNSLTLSTDEVGGTLIHIPFYSSMTTFIEFDTENLKYKTITKAQLPITASLNPTTGLFDIADKNTMVLATTSSSGAYDVIVMKFAG